MKPPTLKAAEISASIWMLSGHRLAAATLVALLCLDSLLAGVSIALLLPLTNIMLATSPAGSAATAFYSFLDGVARSTGGTLTAPFLLLFFAAVLLGKAVLSLITQVGGFWYGQTVLRDWLDRLFAGYIRRDVSVAQSEMRGQAVNIVAREAHHAHGYVINNVNWSAAAIAFLIQLAIMSVVNIKIVAVGALASLVLYLAVFRPLVSMSYRVGKRSLADNKRMTERFVQTLNNLRDIKLLQLEEKKIGEMRADNRSIYRHELKFGIIRSTPAVTLELFFALGIAAFAMAISFYSGDEANRILGEVVFFVVGTYRLFGFASTMTTESVRLAHRKSSFKAIMGELERFESESHERGHLPIEEINSDIEFRNLSHATADGEPILKNISGRILRGRVNVVYGASGSGKTTLLDLLSRLREPHTGAIFVNGQDATVFRREDWRALFGYVSQEPKLFADTVQNNIALGRKEVNDSDVQWALEQAVADEFVSAKTGAEQFWVEEDGANLSGGQRRRIAIARALVTRPKVLILDEATQGIEIGLEKELLQRLTRIGLTTVIVSHRLETAECADQILHLKDGSLSVVGSKSELKSLSSQQSRIA